MNTPAQKKLSAFTVVELLVVVGMIVLLGSTLLPALAKTRPNTQAAQCLNNMRQWAAVFQLFAGDNADVLLSAADELPGRSYWLQSGVLQPYINKSPGLLRCPADQSTRTRCVSMSSVFGQGELLGPDIWRTYAKGAEIVLPAKTFVFGDEHPDSINDGALCNSCTGNQPADPPVLSRIMDWPASYHEGAGSFCFADGRAEIHKWVGTRIKAQMIYYSGSIPFDVPSGDSWVDMHWLAENTTVKR